MKIIFIINSAFPNYSGGIENWLYNISNILADRDLDVTIISRKSNYLPDYYPQINSKIKIVRVISISSFKLFKPFVRGYISLLDMIISSYIMGNKVKSLAFDASNTSVIALDSLFCVKSAFHAKKVNPNINLISSVRGPHGDIYARRFPLFAPFILKSEIRYLKSVDNVWSNGFDTRDSLFLKGVTSDVLFNGIDYYKLISSDITNNKSILNSKFSIISVGTLLPIKGIYEIIDSISLLKEKGYIFDIFFVGKGDSYKYAKYALGKNVKNQVHFIGHKNLPVRYIKACKICVCLSGGGGMSMAAIEALSTGIPVIGWDTPVYQQFNDIKESRINLVENGNVAKLSLMLENIYSNYSLFKNKAEENVEYTIRFDWTTIVDDLIFKLN